MISYDIEYEKKYICVKVHGHANGIRDGKDRDFVCAIASAIVQTALLGCEKYGSAKHTLDEKEGNIDFVCERNRETEALIYAMKQGLGQARKCFPQCFCKE